MRAKVAIYRWRDYPEWDYWAQTEAQAGDALASSHLRVSEFVEVDFPELSQDQVIAEGVRGLQAERAHIVDEFTKKLESVDERLKKLLALPAPAPPAPDAPAQSASPENAQAGESAEA